MEREQVLRFFEQDIERFTAAAVMDRAEKAAETGRPQCTDFLDPSLQRVAERVLHQYKQLKSISWGGYLGAERVRVMIFPAAAQYRTADVPLSALEIEVAGDAGLSHRDYLGAVLGTGLKREKIGDILLVGQGKAQLVAVPEVIPVLLASLSRVGSYDVKVREIDTADLTPAPPRQREIKATVASLRIDAVASAGFGLSRSKLAAAVKAGHLKLNWQSVKSPATEVKAGDVISFAGRGRVELAAVTGESRKGRLQILLKRLL